jgi:hypothetical protein
VHGHRQARHAPTWITLTAAGSTMLAEEIERLKLLITRIETTNTPEDQ